MPATGVLEPPLTPQLDEALPAQYIDAVHDGVRGKRPEQFGMLVSICMATQIRGWSRERTESHVCDPLKSGLWRQLSVDHKGKEFPAGSAARAFRDAWDRAQEHLDDPYNSFDMRQKAVEEAFAVVDLLDDPELDLGLNEPQRATLCFVANEIVRRERRSVTCPTRDVEAATGFNRQRIRTALGKLVQLGWLEKLSSGHSGARHGKAAIFALGPLAR